MEGTEGKGSGAYAFQRDYEPGAGFNGRVNGFTHVDSARPVADQ